MFTSIAEENSGEKVGRLAPRGQPLLKCVHQNYFKINLYRASHIHPFPIHFYKYSHVFEKYCITFSQQRTVSSFFKIL